jgi:hypothetical protein
MRSKRLALLVVAAVAIALVCVVPSLARTQTRHVVVVQGKGFSLLAWDGTSPKGSLCILAKAGKPSSSVCGQKLNSQTGIMFTSFSNKKQTHTIVGGATKKSIKKVQASFSDGTKVIVKTKKGQAYRGRRRGKVRFFALKHKGAGQLRLVFAKPYPAQALAGDPGGAAWRAS